MTDPKRAGRSVLVDETNRQGCPGRFFHGYKVPLWLFVFMVLLSFVGCSLFSVERGYYADRVERMMGTDIRIQIYAADSLEATRVLHAAFERVEELERSWSHFDPDSELSRLNESAGSGEWISVSEDLWDLLEHGKLAWEWTGGRFDMAVGSLVELWRISRRTDRLPEPDILETAKFSSGFQWVELDTERYRVRLTREGLRLDPGGIGKGLAADRVMELLAEYGIERALVDMGGDLLASDPPPGADGWEVWIEVPASLQNPEQTEQTRLSLSNQAVATSGDLFQFADIDGVRYSHIVDPETGLGVQGHNQATVIASRGWVADLYATVAILEGRSVSTRIPESLQLDYLILGRSESGGDLLRWESGSWYQRVDQGFR